MTVDDEEEVTFCLSTVLQETGLFEVDGFTDPQHALSSLKQGKYDLVILDIRMPKMDGFELYKKIKLLDKNVDICFARHCHLILHTFRDIEASPPVKPT